MDKNYKSQLIDAKKNKKDEFYTLLSDIEKELKYYKAHFIGKVILCNCDDPFESNFFKYFAINFNHLGLKRLIVTSYSGSPISYQQLSIFDNPPDPEVIKQKKAYKVVINELKDINFDGVIDLNDIQKLISKKPNEFSMLKGDGDFRSDECVKLLKEADIVVTNPPFSLFNEYLTQLFQFKKDFLIIGNQNAITYRDVFPKIKSNLMWLGISMNGSNRYFQVPNDYELTEKTGKIEKEKKYAFVKSVVWFTNLKNKKWIDQITLIEKYKPEKYPKYDNFDAIEVDKVSKIPYDYSGFIGVPITFLHKYNPNQFEIVGLGNSRQNFTPNKSYNNPTKIMKNGEIKDGGAINSVLTIKLDTPPLDSIYYSDNKKYYIAPFARLIIKRR